MIILYIGYRYILLYIGLDIDAAATHMHNDEKRLWFKKCKPDLRPDGTYCTISQSITLPEFETRGAFSTPRPRRSSMNCLETDSIQVET